MHHYTEIKKLINQNSHLFWFVPDDQKKNLSIAVVLETIFNYGDINAVRNLIKILGIEQAEKIFNEQIAASNRRKGNFHELTLNFFKEFFNHYASRNIQ